MWPIDATAHYPGRKDGFDWYGLPFYPIPGGESAFVLQPYRSMETGDLMTWAEVGRISGLSLPETMDTDPWGEFVWDLTGDQALWLPPEGAMPVEMLERVVTHLVDLGEIEDLDVEVGFFDPCMTMLDRIDEFRTDSGMVRLRDLLENGPIPMSIWDPAGRWYIAGAYEDQSNYVSGSVELIERIMQDPTLEAVRYDPPAHWKWFYDFYHRSHLPLR
ncbi:hypothetical protein GCM10027418_28480 [Mariniluteicoccus endophyticus]